MALSKWIRWLYFHGLGGSATMEYSVASGLEWDFSFCIISPFHIQNHSLSYKRGRTTDGCWHSSTGVSPPRPMLVGAARNALRSVLIARSQREVMAHRTHSSIQDRTYPSALYCSCCLPPGFLCQFFQSRLYFLDRFLMQFCF